MGNCIERPATATITAAMLEEWPWLKIIRLERGGETIPMKDDVRLQSPFDMSAMMTRCRGKVCHLIPIASDSFPGASQFLKSLPFENNKPPLCTINYPLKCDSECEKAAYVALEYAVRVFEGLDINDIGEKVIAGAANEFELYDFLFLTEEYGSILPSLVYTIVTHTLMTILQSGLNTFK